MINDTRKPLHVALGNLIIKAWDATGHWVSEDKAARTVRPALLTSTKQYPPSSFFPDFISKLQAQRAPQSVQRSVVQHNGTASIPANPIRLAQPTAPGILAQTPTYHNSTSKESTISPNYSGSMMLDIPEFESFDISPEAWAEWDRLLANSQTMDISSEFQDPGSWSMYGGFD